MFRLERERRFDGKIEIDIVFGITSLTPEQADAKTLLGFTRGHWGIENGLHGVRDGTFREDASRIRKGSGPQVMAVLRNIAVFWCARQKHKSTASATRHYVNHPENAIKILSTPV